MTPKPKWSLHLVAGEADPVLSVGAAVPTRLLEVQARGGEGLDAVQVRAPGQGVDHVQRLQMGKTRQVGGATGEVGQTHTHTHRPR